MFNPTKTKSAEITFSKAQENILNFYGRYFYHDRKKKVMTENEWINIIRSKVKPFKGILNGAYKLCGIKRCAHVNYLRINLKRAPTL